METGLLESLRKYRPRENKDPLENFITEAFAWILNNHPDFSEFFIDDISSKMQIQGMKGKDCEWRTQYNFDGVFPDMVCRSNNTAIVFENKAWSSLHENQLKNYKDYASKNFDESKIVLITATKYQHAQNPDLALCWSDIYKLISAWLDNNSDSPFIFGDFLRLLKSEGMGPPAPISHKSILYYYASIDLKQNIGNLIKRVENEDWSKNIKQDFKLSVVNEKRGLAYGERWGRMGLDLLNSWTPGIFVGILLDGKDHCTKPINAAKGPDFCLILDFGSNLHSQYPSNRHYIEFVKIVSKKITDLNNGWEFYHHLDDNEVKNKNKWHPIHIRKPMLDVFVGSKTIEEQTNRFYETANQIIKIVTDEACFWFLKDEMKKTLFRLNLKA